MNNTCYNDPNEITFNTIEDFIYLGRHNDVSFLIGNSINLYEHQTTINANITLRMFLYAAKLYEKYAYENNEILYSRNLIKLPDPNFVVFYFGNEKLEDDRFVYLSDAMDIKNSNLELRVRIINANYGHNEYILNKCPILYEYSWFLNEIRVRYNYGDRSGRSNKEKMRHAVDETLKIMPESFNIKKRLLVHKAEVVNMLYTMEDEPRQMRLLEQEWKNEGIAEGILEGRAKGKKEAHEEDLKKTIRLLIKAGLSESEAINMAKEEFEDPSVITQQ